MPGLNEKDLVGLVRSVFPGHPEDRSLAILVDLPRDPAKDNPDWKARRAMAEEWALLLKKGAPAVPLDDVRLVAYPDVGSNNADLPAEGFAVEAGLPSDASGLAACGAARFLRDRLPGNRAFPRSDRILDDGPAQERGGPSRVPGGHHAGILREDDPGPAPGLRRGRPPGRRPQGQAGPGGRGRDRVRQGRPRAPSDGLRSPLQDGPRERRTLSPRRARPGTCPAEKPTSCPTRANGARPAGPGESCPSRSPARCSSSRSRPTGPWRSGRPRRWARPGRTRRSICAASRPTGTWPSSGFGVLGDFGIGPVGEILLDEKLGLHVAFGRSDHFGGQVGPAAFSSPAEVIHLDRIYIPATQPRITVYSVVLRYPDGPEEVLMADGRYRIF